MENYIDLHTHSTASDGTLTPSEIVALCLDRHIKAVALTDHDTINGIDEFMQSGKQLNIETIAGIEIAGDYLEREIHILGLFIDYKNKSLIDFLEKANIKRESRNLLMIERLNKAGFEISYPELKEVSNNGVITRAHYALLMEKKGYVGDKNEAFNKYLGDGKAFYIKRDLPSAKECIEIIKEANGFVVLAHPTLYNMNYREIKKMCQELKLYGLNGIEVMHSTYRHEQEREITKIATEYNLIFSGGSDFHGEIKKNIHIGVGRGNLRIPYEFLDQFKR